MSNNIMKCKDCPYCYDATWNVNKIYKCKAPKHFGGLPSGFRVSIKSECIHFPVYRENSIKYMQGKI